MPRGPRDRSSWGANIKTPYMLKLERERAQAAYVKQWRECHVLAVYVEPWICPLDGRTVQAPAELSPTDYAQAEMIRRHQAEHGDDWLAYQAAGADRPRDRQHGDGS